MYHLNIVKLANSENFRKGGEREHTTSKFETLILDLITGLYLLNELILGGYGSKIIQLRKYMNFITVSLHDKDFSENNVQGFLLTHQFRISYFSSANLKKLSVYQRYQQRKVSDRLV